MEQVAASVLKHLSNTEVGELPLAELRDQVLAYCPGLPSATFYAYVARMQGVVTTSSDGSGRKVARLVA